jgi:hypothetical protein
MFAAVILYQQRSPTHGRAIRNNQVLINGGQKEIFEIKIIKYSVHNTLKS